MDNFYCNMSLDMIALEAAVMNYETLNRFDDFFESVEGSPEVPAAESTTSDSEFAFGADLFVETVATESVYPTEPALEGVGQKIWATIKSIFNAIANFFKNLGKKSEETAKKTEETSKKAKETLAGAEVKVETAKKTEETKEVSKPKSDKRAKAEEKLKAAAAGSSNKDAIAPIVGSEKDYNKGYARSVPSGAGKNLHAAVAKLRPAIDAYCAAIAAALNGVATKDIKTICNRIDTAIKGLGHDNNTDLEKENADPTKKRVDERFENNYTRINMITGATTTMAQDADKLSGIVSDAEKREAELVKLRDKIYDQYALIEKEWKNDGYVITVIKGGNKNAAARLDLSTYAYLTVYEQDNTTNVLKKTCAEIIKVSTTNTAYCQKMMSIADRNANGNGNNNAASNAVYKMCKAYLAISKVYSKISIHVNEVASGSILRRSTNA